MRLVTSVPGGAFDGVKTPASKASPNARPTSTRPILIKCVAFVPSADVGEPSPEFDDRIGNSAIERAAISLAVDSGQSLHGMPAMVRARLSVASTLGNAASLPASCHGSCPSRANTETKQSTIPFPSVPTAAKRNSFNPERRRAKASVLGIGYPKISGDLKQRYEVGGWAIQLPTVRRSRPIAIRRRCANKHRTPRGG